LIFVRTRGFQGVLREVVGFGAGLLLRTLARVVCSLYFLSLLATVRGGTSFLCPTATKKRSKENASPQTVLSVPSVQTTAFGSRVERCSQNHGHLKPSFSRILTSPRFATSALGQERWPADLYRLTRLYGLVDCVIRVTFGRGACLARNTFGRQHTNALGQDRWPEHLYSLTRLYGLGLLDPRDLWAWGALSA
jgi:hypothetical protein